jgi:hypothetical protein
MRPKNEHDWVQWRSPASNPHSSLRIALGDQKRGGAALAKLRGHRVLPMAAESVGHTRFITRP